MKRKLEIVKQRNKLQKAVSQMVKQGDATGVSITLSAVSILNWVLDEEDDTITAEINTTLNKLRMRIDKELAKTVGQLATTEHKA